MPLAQQLRTFPPRTPSRRPKKNAASVNTAPDSVLSSLLQARAQAISAAAQTFYVLIADLEQVSDHLAALQRIQEDARALWNTAMTGATALSTINKDRVCGLFAPLAAITQSIETAASTLIFYQLSPSRADLDALVGLLVAIAQETKAMIAMLQEGYSWARLSPVIAGIQALATHSHKVFREAVIGLQADTALDTWARTPWQDVYETVEQAIRQCAQVAVMVQSLEVN